MVPGGSVAVLVPKSLREPITELLTELGDTCSVLTAFEAKGLEFDTVILLEPAQIVAESPRGVNDLYVAMTRPTQRLTILHSAPLPAGLSSISG